MAWTPVYLNNGGWCWTHPGSDQSWGSKMTASEATPRTTISLISWKAGQYVQLSDGERNTGRKTDEGRQMALTDVCQSSRAQFSFTLCTVLPQQIPLTGCLQSYRILLNTPSPSILGTWASITNSYLLWGLISRRVMLLDICIWSLRFFSYIG